MKFIIITPTHNEEAFIRFTLDSVVAQTIKPQQWIIVDDGSSDGTSQIIQEYVKRYPWITQVTLPRENSRELGARIVRIFYEGFRHINTSYDFLVELDSDLSFSSDYFENILRKFAEDPQLGIAGGGFYIQAGNEWRLEKVPVDHVRGATKIYRKACFDEIGGLPFVDGWDSIDEWRAQMKGWKTRSYNEFVVHHLRPTGSSFGKWGGGIKAGQYAFFLGYPWLAILARSFYRAVSERPPIVIGLALFWGYVQSWLAGKPQYEDAELIAYVRHKQIQRIVHFWRSASR